MHTAKVPTLRASFANFCTCACKGPRPHQNSLTKRKKKKKKKRSNDRIVPEASSAVRSTTILIGHPSAGRLPSKMSGPSHSAPRRRRAAGCVPSDNGHMLKSKGALLHVIGGCRQLQPMPQVFSVGGQ